MKVWTDEELYDLTPGGLASIEAIYSEGFEQNIYRKKWVRVRPGLYARLIGLYEVQIEQCTPEWCPRGMKGWRDRVTRIGPSWAEEASEWPQHTLKAAKENAEKVYGLSPTQRFKLFPQSLQDEVRNAYFSVLDRQGIDAKVNAEEVADLVSSDLTDEEIMMAVHTYLTMEGEYGEEKRTVRSKNPKKSKLTDEEVVKKLKHFIMLDSPRSKTGKRKIIYQSWHARDMADDLGISMQRLRKIVDKYGDSMFKTAVVYYEKSERTGGSSSPVTPWEYSDEPAQTWPALVVVEPRDRAKRLLKSKLLR